jgi:hypothetical protein
MGENVITSSALTDVAERPENGMPENEVPGTAVPENNAISGSCTAVAQNEPEWYRDGDAWVKLFLEPIEPGKFEDFGDIYNVPGENEFPRERWCAVPWKDGFHITRRKDVWRQLKLHGYKSAYIAEVVSMGDEFYDNPSGYKRKVRVVTFGPAVPVAEVFGKLPNDFKNGEMLIWSAASNYLEMVKIAFSKNPDSFSYSQAFGFALKYGNDQISDFLIEKCRYDNERQEILCNATWHGRVDLVNRLMENMPVNVKFFKEACWSGQFKIYQLLCTKYGEPKCSDIILSALDGGNVNILNYLKSRGVDMTDLGMFVYTCRVLPPPVEAVKYLVSQGANVNHPLIAYIVKRYEDEIPYKEVRKFLLDHIDDKSEVPKCEVLEREIDEIFKKFIKMIKAGEFE